MLVLASASPRRKQLLSLLTTDFEVEVSNVDETVPENVTASDAAAFLATKKEPSAKPDSFLFFILITYFHFCLWLSKVLQVAYLLR